MRGGSSAACSSVVTPAVALSSLDVAVLLLLSLVSTSLPLFFFFSPFKFLSSFSFSWNSAIPEKRLLSCLVFSVYLFSSREKSNFLNWKFCAPLADPISLFIPYFNIFLYRYIEFASSTLHLFDNSEFSEEGILLVLIVTINRWRGVIIFINIRLQNGFPSPPPFPTNNCFRGGEKGGGDVISQLNVKCPKQKSTKLQCEWKTTIDFVIGCAIKLR